VDNRPGHTAEHRLYNIQELGTGGQWGEFDPGTLCSA
jgi:hypothetical protein